MAGKLSCIIILILGFATLSAYSHKERATFDNNDWADSLCNTLSLEEKIGQLLIIDSGIDVNIDFQRNKPGGIRWHKLPPKKDSNTRDQRANNKLQAFNIMDANILHDILPRHLKVFSNSLMLDAIQDEQLNYLIYLEKLRLIAAHSINTIENPFSFDNDSESSNSDNLKIKKALSENGFLIMQKAYEENGKLINFSTGKPFYLQPVGNDSLNDRIPEYLTPDAIIIRPKDIRNRKSDRGSSKYMSKKFIHDHIRKQFQFKGLLIADLSFNNCNTENIVKALITGYDMVIVSLEAIENLEDLVNTINKGVLKKDELNQKVLRVLRTKSNIGKNPYKKFRETNHIYPDTNTYANILKERLYESAITIVKDSIGIIPFRHLDTTTFASLSMGVEKPNEFQKYLNFYSFHMQFYLERDENDLWNYSSLLYRLSQFDIVNVSLHNIINNPESNYGITRDNLDFLRALSNRTTVVLTIFGTPHCMNILQDFDFIICAYEDNQLMHRIVPQILFGALPAKGVLPVNVSSIFTKGTGEKTDRLGRLSFSIPERTGMDSKTLSYIDSIAVELIRKSASPGCQVLAARKGKVIYNKSFGYHTYDSIIPVDQQSIYDLASITKVAGTIQALMFLYCRDLIDLDKKASYYIPELKGTNKEDMIIRDLITHHAGLRPYFPFYRYTLKGEIPKKSYYSSFKKEPYTQEMVPGMFAIHSLRDSVWRWTIQSHLRDKEEPSKPYDYQYSDMGYYILQEVIEKVINQPLDEFLNQNIYAPLGLQSMTYNPLCKYPVTRITPTESDANYRKKLLHGQVHDENAAMYGGVAGHSGLFSSSLDLAILMQMNLQDGYYGGIKFLKPGIVKIFTDQQYHNNRKGLGWDKPETRPMELSPVSWFASSETYGHSGFTGTCVWIDPVYDLVYVFLSNRIYPDRENSKLFNLDFRMKIQNILYDSILTYKKNYKL